MIMATTVCQDSLPLSSAKSGGRASLNSSGSSLVCRVHLAELTQCDENNFVIYTTKINNFVQLLVCVVVAVVVVLFRN